VVKAFYDKCRRLGKINFNRFKKIITVYQYLTKEHVKFMLDKGIISQFDALQLNE
jgi:hypothetical protein